MDENLVYVDLHHKNRPDDYTGPRWQPWSIIVRSGDNEEPLFRSTESYINREDAVHAARLAFGSQANVYLRETEMGNVELRLASPPPQS